MRKKIIISFLLLTALIVSQIILLQFVTIAKSTDGILYDGIAKAILHGNATINQPGLRGHGADIGSVVMPGYPFIIAFIYSIFGINFYAFISFQVILGAVACIVYYSICQKSFNQWIALFATLWLIGYIETWRYNYQYLMDSLTASMLIFSLFFLQKYFNKYNPKYLYIFTILFGLIIAVNNRFIVHIILLGGYLLFTSLKDRKIKAKQVLIVSSIILLILLPWHIRQVLHYDKAVLFSPIRTEQALGSNNNKKNKFPSYELQKKSLESGFASIGAPSNYIHLFTEEKYEKMKENYNAFNGLNKYVSRLKGFFEIIRTDFRFGFGGDTRITPPNVLGTVPILHMIFTLTFLGSMFLFMVPGIIFAFKKNNRFYISLLVLVTAHILLHSFVGIDPWLRYRVPIIPGIFLLGWYGLQNIINLLPFKQMNVLRTR